MQQAQWRRGVISQVHLRSLMNSNGDGVGDLRGMLACLDYIRWLGVDVP